MSDSFFKRTLRQLSHRSRTKKFDLLLQLFRPRPEDRVLDIGASGEVFLRYTLEDVYPHPDRIVAGGYELSEFTSARNYYPPPQYAVFDGCSLPFPDKSFDLGSRMPSSSTSLAKAARSDLRRKSCGSAGTGS